MSRASYRQTLPDLDLSIERYTDAVPDDGAWYLIRSDERIGRFRSLKEAKAAWDRIIAESGWKPSKRDLDSRSVLNRERRERWSRNRAG